MLWFLQSKLLYHPDRAMDITPKAAGLDFEDITFRSANGKSLHGWFIPRYKARATVLFCHGNAGNISHRMAIIQMLYKLDLQIFLFDYQGYGQSDGTPSEQGTYEDVRAAWNLLRNKKKIPHERILVMGRSLGGSIASHLASQVQPKALILDSTFSSFVDIGKAHFSFLPVSLLARFKYTTAENIKNKNYPLLMFHSPTDEVIPFKLGKKCYDTAPEPKTFVKLSGGHNDSFYVSGRKYTKAIQEFVNKHFPRID